MSVCIGGLYCVLEGGCIVCVGGGVYVFLLVVCVCVCLGSMCVLTVGCRCVHVLGGGGGISMWRG